MATKGNEKNESNIVKEPSQTPAPDMVNVDSSPGKSVSPSSLAMPGTNDVEGQQTEVKSGKQAKVNPVLDTVSVTIPYGFDDEGQLLYHHFLTGKSYTVSADLLEVKNAEKVNLLVEDN